MGFLFTTGIIQSLRLLFVSLLALPFQVSGSCSRVPSVVTVSLHHGRHKATYFHEIGRSNIFLTDQVWIEGTQVGVCVCVCCGMDHERNEIVPITTTKVTTTTTIHSYLAELHLRNEESRYEIRKGGDWPL